MNTEKIVAKYSFGRLICFLTQIEFECCCRDLLLKQLLQTTVIEDLCILKDCYKVLLVLDL